MKKIIYIFIGCLLLTSCSGMLDIESHSAVSPGSVTSQDLSALRMGMYNKVQNSPTRESYITFDILGGDLTQSTGNAKDLINSVLSSLNSIVSNSWNGYYNALYQVNNVLSIVESLPESELRNLIIGEAHYFRAYIYHALVTRWGGVPIQKVNTMEKPFRDSEEAVWSFIEEELQTALAFLGTSSSYYYVSRDAALAYDKSGSRVLAAVNGDFFAKDGTPQGIYYRNGTCLKGTMTDNVCTFFAITKNKRAIIGSYDEYDSYKENIQEAVGGRVRLMTNGNVLPQTVTALEPRTAIGVTDDNVVYILVADGRNFWYSNGMRYAEMGAVMKALGAKNAINLDGGGSSTFIIRKIAGFEDGRFAIRNWPYDNGGVEREVANGLLVVIDN